MKATVVFCALALSGCATADLPAASLAIDCTRVHVVTYSPDFEKQLVDEIKAAAPNAVWPSAIADYRATRYALQACPQAVAVH